MWKFHINRFVFYAVYEVEQGICLNENGKFYDIFANGMDTRYTLSECKDKCDSTDGCKAVSYHEAGSTCHGTSWKVTTTSETHNGWKCYYRPGYKPSTYISENILRVLCYRLSHNINTSCNNVYMKISLYLGSCNNDGHKNNGEDGIDCGGGGCQPCSSMLYDYILFLYPLSI